ncbi:hypothetical protein BGZ63DRAFT_474121 [Mariannaea sp. PMI_226]|nr:hypothetical protein BGZ63DRAFT_474121 [Mariannaea sp. PMI_226]
MTGTPKRRQHYRPKVKGCYECSQRRINCDKGEPECKKCINKGLKCSGLGIRHRFHTGVAVRGKWAGMTMQSIYAEQAPPAVASTTPPMLTPTSWALDNLTLTSSSTDCAFPADDDTISEVACAGGSVAGPSNHLSTELDYNLAPSSMQQPSERDKRGQNLTHQSRCPETSISFSTIDIFQRIPDSITSWKRALLLHFSDNIAKEMIAIDGIHNGWRHLVLPLAHADQLVMDAVLAVSAFHLSSQEARHTHYSSRSSSRGVPSFSFFTAQQHYSNSQQLYAHAIQGLQKRQKLATCDKQDQHLVLLTILILLVSVMVTGSKDFPILFNMLQSALQAIGGEVELDDGDLSQFIIRQIHKMRVYAAPLLDEESGRSILSSQEHMVQAFECLNYCARQRPDAASAVPLIMSLVEQAHEIYLQQVLRDSSTSSSLGCPSRPCTVPPSTTLVQRFKETLEDFPPGLPGEQVLIWATFIAGSDCVTDEHKSFFEGELLRHFDRSGFINLLSGLEHLRTIWTQRSLGASWTSLLPQTGVFIM